MILFVLSYLGGVLTILSPCILPVLPFVFARSDQPFVRSGLPLLVGHGAHLRGGRDACGRRRRLGRASQPVWAHRRHGAAGAVRHHAAVSGAGRPVDPAAGCRRRPAVATGAAGKPKPARSFRRSCSAWRPGLLWAPCAGPILGLVLTGAALQGANAQTTLLLLAYAAGAATSLAAGPADRRARVRGDEALARRRRMDPARIGRRGARRRCGYCARARHRGVDPNFARTTTALSKPARSGPPSRIGTVGVMQGGPGMMMSGSNAGGAGAMHERSERRGRHDDVEPIRRSGAGIAADRRAVAVAAGALAGAVTGSIRRRSVPTICAARSCWSISGPTPASTACARCPMCEAWAEKYKDARAGGDRRPRAGIRLREEHRQCRAAPSRI